MLIGLHGRAGSGKDTAADFIEKYAKNKTFKKFSFAQPLKDAVKIMFNLTDEHIIEKKEDPVLNPDGSVKWHLNGQALSPRLILQWLGTDILRNQIKESFHVDNMRDRIKEALKDTDIVVITDVRFLNEAEMIKELGGFVIRLERNTTRTIHTGHASEQRIDLVDHVIDNNGSLEDLEKNLISII